MRNSIFHRRCHHDLTNDELASTMEHSKKHAHGIVFDSNDATSNITPFVFVVKHQNVNNFSVREYYAASYFFLFSFYVTLLKFPKYRNKSEQIPFIL